MCLFARERYTSVCMTVAKLKLSLCHCEYVLLANSWSNAGNVFNLFVAFEYS